MKRFTKRINKVTSLLLCVVMLLASTVVSGYANQSSFEDEIAQGNNSCSISTGNNSKVDGVKLKRTVTSEGDGTFDVTLEALVQGGELKTPTDFFFVVDISSSNNGESLEIMKNALRRFIEVITEQNKLYGLDHRIGFVSYSNELLGGTYMKDGALLGNSGINPISWNNAKKYVRYYTPGRIENEGTEDKVDHSAVLDGRVGAAVRDIGAIGGTRTDYALEFADYFLNKTKIQGRKQACVVMSDGVPSLGGSFNVEYANTAHDYATKLKSRGIELFTCFTNLKSDQKARLFSQLLSSCYKAEGTTPKWKTEGFIVVSYKCNYDAAKLDTQKPYFIELTSLDSKEYQEKLLSAALPLYHPAVNMGKSAIVQEVVPPYFAISDLSVHTETNTHENGDSWVKDTQHSCCSLNISNNNNTIQATGFDFARHFDSVNNTSGPKKVVIKYRITPINTFLGGNNVNTCVEPTAFSNTNNSGSCLYCDDTCYGIFKDIKVNVPIKDGSLELNEQFAGRVQDSENGKVYNVDYGTKVTPADLFSIDSKVYNGVNNAFVKVLYEFKKDETNTDKLEITNNTDISDDDFKDAFGGSYEVKTSVGNKFEVTCTVTPITNKASPTNIYSEVYSGTAKSVNATIKTDTEFTAKFKYVGEQKIIEAILEAFQLPEIEASQFPDLDASQLPKIEILEKDPDGFIKLTGFREDIESYVAKLNEQMEGKKAGDIAEALGGSADGLDDFTDINFLGWELVNEKGTELRYEGEWSGKGQVKVNVYTADLNRAQLEFEYPSTPDWHFTADVPVGSTTQIVKTAKFGYDPIDFKHSMAFYYYDENDSFQELTDDVLNANYGGFSKDANGVQVNEYIQYGIQYKDAETGETKIKELEYAATVNTNFCNECGGLVTSAGATSRKDGELLYECPHCGTTNPTIEFSDYELDEALSSKDALSGEEITVGGVTTINLYIKPCEHEYTVTVTIDDKTNVYTAPTFTDYFLYDTAPEISDALWDVLVDSKTDSVLHNFPYVQVEALKPSGFFSPDYLYDGSGDPFVGNTNYDMWFKTDFVDWVGCDPEEYDLYSVLETAFMSISSGGFNDWLMGYGTGHDLSFEVAVKTDEYDLDLKKLWADNVSEADKQTCIFALYEVNEEASDTESPYKLVTRFAVNPNNSNAVLSGLKAGKHYLIEEESWSYKTSSGCFRGGTNRIEFSCACASEESEKGWYAKENGDVLLGEDTFTYQVSCTNNINENWKGGMTSDKGVINKYNGTSIDCIPIIKKQKGDKLK